MTAHSSMFGVIRMLFCQLLLGESRVLGGIDGVTTGIGPRGEGVLPGDIRPI